ncbi:hypothetical protein [Amycolatopsis sp. NPDC049868]|uniref:hypothetical protein n=1 Tax=Amycolatopsis sp. NPDC049868 TaxID=3363934 RepID=UPI0037B3C9E5
MMNAAKTLGAGFVLAATAACGAGGPGAPANTSTPPVVTTPSDLPTSLPASPPGTKPPMSRPTVGPPPSDKMLPPSQVETKLPVQVSAENGGLNVHLELSGCDEARANLAEENAQRVVVTVTIDHAKPGEMCPQVIRYAVLPVKLAQPLGTRKVIV